MNKILPLKTKLIIVRLFLCVALSSGMVTNLWSQQSDTIVPVQKDPEKILRKIDIRKMNQMGFNFWQDNFSGHWAGVDFGFNTFLNPDYSGYNTDFMENDLLRSNSTYINLIEQNIGLQRNRNTIGLVTGLGLHLQSYRLDKSTTIRQTENGIIEPETLYFDQNQKSKLSIASLMVPLLAEFQIPVNHYKNRFYISAGLFGEVRISSHTKIKYRAEGKKEKLKVPGQYAIHNFRYGIMARTGYRRLNIFATYDLIPLFADGKGPELTPFTIGITLIKF